MIFWFNVNISLIILGNEIDILFQDADVLEDTTDTPQELTVHVILPNTQEN